MNSNTDLHFALEAKYYTSPDLFEKERSSLQSKTWLFACHESEIPNEGDYYAFELCGENLFVIRGKDGQERTFYNVCQHRAHQLVKRKGNCRLIICPYHSWTYELEGKLRSGPNLNAVQNLDRDGIKLQQVKTENFHGFIFVNFDANASGMDEWFPGVRETLAEYVPDLPLLKPMQWIEIPEKCNWKTSVENHSECYHCQINHRAFSKGVIDPSTYDIQPQGYCLRHTTQMNKFEAMTYDVDLSIPHATDYTTFLLWPMFAFQVYPGNMLNTYHWRPHDVDHCTVWRGWFSINGEFDEVIDKLAVQDRATTVAEDIRLVESVGRGLKSRGYKPGPLVVDPACGVNSEHSIMHLHRWFREAIEL